MEILYAALVLGGMGVAFGLLLTLTSKIFAVPENPLRDSIREALPGANCGGCGYPGCDGCAEAIAAGKAPVNACPVGGAAAAAKIASAMGVEAQPEAVRKIPHVICQGDLAHCRVKFNYSGIQDCVSASLVNGGNKSCQYACLGLGTCEKACPFDAIHVDPNLKIAKIDEDKCQSCGKCVESCPKHVLEMQEVTVPVRLMCRAAEKGILVSDNCKIGCVGCEFCLRACHFGAITMVNNLPVIDREKCRGCMMCAEACPTGAIWADFDNRKIAEIDQSNCVGCDICKKQCHFEAIDGELRTPHVVNAACTGCGACADKCPKKCITLKVREHTRDAYSRVGTTPPEVLKPAPEAPKPEKPKFSPEVQARIDAALKAKAEREAAAKAEEQKNT